ncbi:hypothetical protein L210DRAFT_3608606 [Boletus edulis BED1]|uniref:Ubiquitin-like protease family profile domain-containing protein n=1 Tax=Boletus edulis BED1 TaxID=1328754 RepID=A0AAD4GMF8_BOLED|nr:hypothetical protein L210DRAFT_3608606 [Boletus edulis BED1]
MDVADDHDFPNIDIPPPRAPNPARRFDNWKKVIPTLVEPYMQYVAGTHGKPIHPPSDTLSLCAQACEKKKNVLTCLYVDLLVRFGLFPSAPSQPRIAVSADLLSFYRALFERSCDAVNALASALNAHYLRRGFRLTGRQGYTVQEPFRRSLGRAIQWHDVLHLQIECRLEAAIAESRARLSEARLIDKPDLSTPNPSDSPVTQPSCPPILVSRCPACFGGNTFGRPLDAGADIHVATDGNFHHRHRRSAGDCPIFFEPAYFIPKSQVDAMGQRILQARKRSPRDRREIVPDVAVDQCESSYEAADGKKQKTAMDCFDDTGLMALICRHDSPLFFANIDTPGEQQKFSIALIEHLFSLLPDKATVTVFYDIGCVTHRSLQQFDILPAHIISRLRFATSAMHAYGHGWACQLVYNPRLTDGLGLSDGEGAERLWSQLIKLIGVERASSRQRRIWLLDRQAAAIGHDLRHDLGPWLKRRIKKGVQEQGATSQAILDTCSVTIPDLEAQWAAQRAAQLSIRSHAPVRLKKELDSVLALQADLDSSERALQTARAAIVEKDGFTKDVIDVLDSMERSHNRLLEKIEALYASLNVQDRFPQLDGIPLDFVRTLLMARDLKINIRKRAIASFFEWDKLDWAVGGKDQTLGTKLHQQTCKAISRRQPALMSALRKYNRYCEQLADSYDLAYAIPLPSPLSTKLAELQGDPSLLQDVWISPAEGSIPRWLEDADVRDGIRAMLKRECCREEQRRLGFEADNMCRWFGQELFAVELATLHLSNLLLRTFLQQRREELLHLPEHWVSPLATSARYEAQRQEAIRLAHLVAGNPAAADLQWVPPVTCSLSTSDGVETDEPDSELDDVLASKDDEDDDSHNGAEETIIRPPADGFGTLIFEPQDIDILASQTATHDLPRIRYNADDHTLWRTISRTRYWEKNIWILPIHRASSWGHWVLCTIDLNRRRLLLFDSLADQRGWKKDIPDICQFVCRLLKLAFQKHASHWNLVPIECSIHAEVTPVQTNDVDCGLWVLAQLAAVLRGHDLTGMQETDMAALRQYLYHLVVTLPVDDQ